MFFETTIQSINKNVITDIQGRKLSTIGDLPLVVGEKVWTDGKIIFGHVFEGTSQPSFGTGGIPVLGTIDDDEKMRGYIKDSGLYRKYPIAEGDYILNAKQKYYHGASDILDAEVALDDKGNEIGLYTAEISFPMPPSADDVHYFYYHVYFTQKPGKYFTADLDLYNRLYPTQNTSDPIVQDCEIIIKKDGDIINRLKLSEIVSDYVNFIIGLVDIKIRHPQYFDNQSVSATLYNFKLDSRGNWTALVFFSGSVRRRFYVLNTEGYYNTETIDYDHQWIDIPYDDTNYEQLIKNTANMLREMGLDENYTGIGAMVPEGQSLEDFLRTTNLAIAIRGFFDRYSSPCTIETTFQHTALGKIGQRDQEPKKTATTRAEVGCLMQYSSDKAPKKLMERVKVSPLEMTEHVSEYSRSPTPPTANSDGFPVIRLINSEEHTLGKRTEFIVSSHLGIGEVSRDVAYVPMETFYFYEYEYTYTAEKGYANPDYKEVDFAEPYFDFPVQDNFFVRFNSSWDSPHSWGYYGHLPKCTIQGIFDATKKVCDDITQDNDDVLKLNLSAVQLKKNTDSYLIGVHNDKLYKVQKNESTVIGDDLKNFRLRRMKNIAKARK